MTCSRQASRRARPTTASTSPGQLPDNVASVTTKGTNDFIMHLKGKVNTSWFTTTSSRSRTSASTRSRPRSGTWLAARRPAPGLHGPANAKKIFDFLLKQGETPATFATNRYGRPSTARSS